MRQLLILENTFQSLCKIWNAHLLCFHFQAIYLTKNNKTIITEQVHKLLGQ